MKKAFSRFLLPAAAAVVLVLALPGCQQTADDEYITYGGSSPVGDYIVIDIDEDNSVLRKTNHTTGDATEWLAYEEVASSETYASGFTLLCKVTLSDTTDYVLFAEYDNAALIYQMMDGTTDSPKESEWPVFVVSQAEVAKSSYYEKSYNWMKFFIDENSNDSSMNCGFAAFDTEGENGLMFAAGYNSDDDTISDVNDGDVTQVASFEDDPDSNAKIFYNGAESPENAVVLTGTASGTNILDFGPGIGGGSGLMIPQADVSLTDAAGTYFLTSFSEDASGQSVDYMKAVISTSGIKVYQYSDDTSTATPQFDAALTKLNNLSAADSPGGAETVAAQFAAASGLSGAASSSIAAANTCPGTYIAQDSGIVVCIIFEPDANFLGFTLSDSNDNSIMFGMGIKDSAYTN